MSKFKQDDKVVISSECEDARFRGISGTVLDVSHVQSSDGLVNRVSLDRPVNNACVFWFADHELQEANRLVHMSDEQIERTRCN
jgi:hypothetical protein